MYASPTPPNLSRAMNAGKLHNQCAGARSSISGWADAPLGVPTIPGTHHCRGDPLDRPVHGVYIAYPGHLVDDACIVPASLIAYGLLAQAVALASTFSAFCTWVAFGGPTIAV